MPHDEGESGRMVQTADTTCVSDEKYVKRSDMSLNMTWGQRNVTRYPVSDADMQRYDKYDKRNREHIEFVLV